eukprot:GFYU01005543.1.p1 GENE.GFYU01005543.1~~GFYU01005543.1.p1  ORF type:complete len:1141 (-),score=237.75 GFYU01005543.1:208-3489(-)
MWLVIVLVVCGLGGGHYGALAQQLSDTMISVWPMALGDHTRGGRTNATSFEGAKIGWKLTTKGSIKHSAVLSCEKEGNVGGETVFVTNVEGEFHGVREKNDVRLMVEDVGGEPDPIVYMKAEPGSFSTSPALNMVTCGEMYVGGEDHELRAIDLTRNVGSIKWSYKTGGKIDSSPFFLRSGIVGFGGTDGQVYFVDSNLQSLAWSYQLPEGETITEALTASIEQDVVYVPTDESNLFALNMTSRTELWSAQHTAVVSTPASVFRDKVEYLVYTTYDGWLYIRNGLTAEKLVRVHACPNGKPTGVATKMDGSFIVFGCGSDIVAVGWDGTEIYRHTTGGAVIGEPALYGDGVAVFGSTDKVVYAMHPNGTVKWTFQAEGQLTTSPAVGSDGSVYIGCNDGHLYGIKEAKQCGDCHHGTCDVNMGWCQCDEGWTGDFCDQCGIGRGGADCHEIKRCPSNCFGNGACDDRSGKCTCNEGYIFAACSACNETAGYQWYPDCHKPIECEDNCNGFGDCDHQFGRCKCTKNTMGASCQHCEDGYEGWPNCYKTVECEDNCNWNGFCNRKTGTCECKVGYNGTLCDSCANDFISYPNCVHELHCGVSECSNHGICDTHTGVCKCDQTYGGPHCGQCERGFEQFPDCFQSISCSSSNCTGNGVCDHHSGTCVCNDGFGGAHCDLCAQGYYGYPGCYKPQECGDQSCSGHGHCDSRSGHCNCERGFAGLHCHTCATEYEGYPSCWKACDVACSSRQKCDVSIGECMCTGNYTGAGCQMCAPGFVGTDICTLAVECVGGCSGNGWCDEVRGVCDCRNGYSGKSCEIAPSSAKSPVALFNGLGSLKWVFVAGAAVILGIFFALCIILGRRRRKRDPERAKLHKKRAKSKSNVSTGAGPNGDHKVRKGSKKQNKKKLKSVVDAEVQSDSDSGFETEAGTKVVGVSPKQAHPMSSLSRSSGTNTKVTSSIGTMATQKGILQTNQEMGVGGGSVSGGGTPMGGKRTPSEDYRKNSLVGDLVEHYNKLSPSSQRREDARRAVKPRTVEPENLNIALFNPSFYSATSGPAAEASLRRQPSIGQDNCKVTKLSTHLAVSRGEVDPSTLKK